MLKDLFWRIRYSFIAKKKDKVKATSRAVSEDSFSKIMKDIIQKMNFNKDDIVLDLGCANAELLRLISGRIKSGVGFDSVKEMIAAARKNTVGVQNLDFQHGDMRDLSMFKDQTFTKVVSYSAFHYLNNKTEAFEVIEQIKRICKNGAIVLIGDLPDDRKGLDQAKGVVDKVSYLLHVRYNREELVDVVTALGGKARIVEQSPSLPHHYQMFDLMIEF